MDSTILGPAASSTVPESCISSETQKQPPCGATAPQLLEISLISAQDLAPISKSMHTYAVTWIHPNRKRRTQTDEQGYKNPKWNEKFAFRLDNETIQSEDATLTVDIYAVSCFRDVLVGTVAVLIADLITPTQPNHRKNKRFVALQIRRPSGSPQGILNMGIALLDKRDNFHETNEVHDNEAERETNEKVNHWRSTNECSEVINEDFFKPGSVYNDNGSELCSDIGPSASIVAAELAKMTQPINSSDMKKPDWDRGSSILEEMTFEEATAKGYINERKAKGYDDYDDYGDDDDNTESELYDNRRHPRRRTRSNGDGLFSCIGTVFGIEFKIVCGGNNKKARSSSKRRIKQS